MGQHSIVLDFVPTYASDKFDPASSAATVSELIVSRSRLTELTHRGVGGARADGGVDGDSGAGHALATADAAVCVGGSRLMELTDREMTKAAELTALSELIVSGS